MRWIEGGARASLAMALALSLSRLALAQSPSNPPPAPPASPQTATPATTPAATPGESVAPDEGFLEFLGSDDVGDAAWWEFLKKAPPRGSVAPAPSPQDAKQ